MKTTQVYHPKEVKQIKDSYMEENSNAPSNKPFQDQNRANNDQDRCMHALSSQQLQVTDQPVTK